MTLQGKDPLVDVFEEPLIKIPHTSISSGGYWRRLAGGDFCGCFSSSALIIVNHTGVFNKRKHQCAQNIGTPDTMCSVHTLPVHRITVLHQFFTNILHWCLIKKCAKTETDRCGIRQLHWCAHKTPHAGTGLNKKIKKKN